MKISRRNFIKASGLALAATACSPKSIGKKAEKKSGEMTLRTNPNTNDNVSLLGYGCMRWAWKDGPDGTKVIDQESVNKLIDYALDHGINYFDTAPVYLKGQCEPSTGEALARHPRDSYYIATKCSNFWNAHELEGVMNMFFHSLEYLKTEYIDYYLLHSVGGEDDFNERYGKDGIMDFFLEQRDKGVIRNLGFSFHGSQKDFDFLMGLHDKYHWDFVQIQMNYVDWTHAGGRNCRADYLYQELEKRGIPVVIMEPLLGGTLAKVPDFIANQLLEQEPSQSIASWAFRFNGTFPGVLTILSGMACIEHLEDNIKTFSPLEPLNSDELDFLEQMAGIIKDYPTVPCTGCDYCMPCPYNVSIPDIFAHYNKCVNEGVMTEIPDEDSEEKRAYKRARRAYLATYGRAVSEENGADHCIGCDACKPKCPQHINISKELHKIEHYIENLKKNG